MNEEQSETEEEKSVAQKAKLKASFQRLKRLTIVLVGSLTVLYILTLAVRLVWLWWGVSHISVESFNTVMKVIPWWPLVACLILYVLATRHRGSIDYLIRNLRLKHGDTEFGSNTQMAIDTGSTNSAQNLQAGNEAQENGGKALSPEQRVEELVLVNEELTIKLMYYQLNQQSRMLLKRLSREPERFVSSKELNGRVLGSNEVTSEIRALQTAGLIVREGLNARSYKITEKGQKVIATAETDLD